LNATSNSKVSAFVAVVGTVKVFSFLTIGSVEPDFVYVQVYSLTYFAAAATSTPAVRVAPG
jgi:hypothetical protein